jgi:hypothetical protein
MDKKLVLKFFYKTQRIFQIMSHHREWVNAAAAEAELFALTAIKQKINQAVFLGVKNIS